jgi:hypothetical protein
MRLGSILLRLRRIVSTATGLRVSSPWHYVNKVAESKEGLHNHFPAESLKIKDMFIAVLGPRSFQLRLLSHLVGLAGRFNKEKENGEERALFSYRDTETQTAYAIHLYAPLTRHPPRWAWK